MALVINEFMFIIKENGTNVKVITKYSMREFAILDAQGKFLLVASYDATGKKIK